MDKIEIVQKLYQAEQKQLKLTINYFKEIIEDNASNIPELFECDINHNDGKISIVGAMIKFLGEDDLIKDENFRSLFLENSPLSEQTAYKMANRNELSPIAMAIALNRPKLVKFLLEKNPQLNYKTAIKHPDSQLSPIAVAVTKNNRKVIEFLIKDNPSLIESCSQKFNDGKKRTAIGIAIINDNLEMVKFLLSKKPNLLTYPAENLENGILLSPIGVSVAIGKTEITSFLLERSPALRHQTALIYPEKYELTPMGIAIINKKPEIVKLLLDMDPNLIFDETVYFKNNLKRTPTALAILSEDPEILKLILHDNPNVISKKAEINSSGAEITPFGFALREKIENAEYLLQINPNLVNESIACYPDNVKKLPLSFVANSSLSPEKKNKIIDFLLDYGAFDDSPIQNLSDEQQAKLNQNKETYLLFQQDNSNIKKAGDVNIKYLLNLCKTHQVPAHLLNAQYDFLKEHLAPLNISEEERSSAKIRIESLISQGDESSKSPDQAQGKRLRIDSEQQITVARPSGYDPSLPTARSVLLMGLQR